MTSARRIMVSPVSAPPSPIDPRTHVAHQQGYKSGYQFLASAGDNVLYATGNGNVIEGGGNNNVFIRKMDSDFNDLVTPVSYGTTDANDVRGMAWSGTNLIVLIRKTSVANPYYAVSLDENLNEVAQAELNFDVRGIDYDPVANTFRFYSVGSNIIGEMDGALNITNVYDIEVQDGGSPLGIVRPEQFYTEDPDYLYFIVWARPSADANMVVKLDRTNMTVAGQYEYLQQSASAKPISGLIWKSNFYLLHYIGNVGSRYNGLTKINPATMAFDSMVTFGTVTGGIYGLVPYDDVLMVCWIDSSTTNYSVTSVDETLTLIEELRLQGTGGTNNNLQNRPIKHQNLVTMPFTGNSGQGSNPEEGMIFQTDENIDALVGTTLSCAPNIAPVDPNRPYASVSDNSYPLTFVLSPSSATKSASSLTRNTAVMPSTECDFL